VRVGTHEQGVQIESARRRVRLADLRRHEVVRLARIELQRLDELHARDLEVPPRRRDREARRGHGSLLLVEIRDGARPRLHQLRDLVLEGRLRRQILLLHPELLLIRDHRQVVGGDRERGGLPRAGQVLRARVRAQVGLLERRDV
jgi:hypothetical protein